MKARGSRPSAFICSEVFGTVFNPGLRVCVIDAEYSVLTQNEIMSYYESYWRKKVTSYISTSKVAGKKDVFTSPKWAHGMTVIQFQTSCLRLVFMSDRSELCRFDALHKLLCRSIRPSFVDFVLLFLFHYETATKANFIFFYKKENGSWVWKARRCPLELFKVSIS